MPESRLLERGTVGRFDFLRPDAAQRIVDAVRLKLRDGLTLEQFQHALELLTNELMHARLRTY